MVICSICYITSKLLCCADVESTKALQDQVLSVDGPKSDMVDSLEVKRLKDEMTSMKKKIMGE